jgi:hypothetical protein
MKFPLSLCLSLSASLCLCWHLTLFLAPQVDNASPYVVSLSHLPFQSTCDTSAGSPWEYFYPHESHHSSSSHDLTLRQLSPHSSTNIIVSISHQTLWKWFEDFCLEQRRPLQEALDLLLETVTLYWVIRLSDSQTSNLFEGQSGNSLRREFTRSGLVSFRPLNSQQISKALLLPLLELEFKRPSLPSALRSSKVHLSVRKFHPLFVTISCSLPLLMSLFNHISREQIVKIEIESILLLLSDLDDGGRVIGTGETMMTSPSHPLQAKNCIVTGNPHQLIPIPLSSSSDSTERQTVQHEISCCFTRCGGYKLYPIARLLIEYRPSASAQNTIVSPSSWWIPQQPSMIFASPV